MEENKTGRPLRRRRHSPVFKAEAVAACTQPGVSIAAVAMRYQLNANLLRRWVAEHEGRAKPANPPVMAMPSSEFIPLQMSAVSQDGRPQDIVIEVRRGAATVTVRWPATAATECATWLLGWLR
jgi:transposase-like protein